MARDDRTGPDGTSAARPAGEPDRRETAAYVAAVLILVVGGAFIRTPILNWIIGPGVVVVCVAVATMGRDREGTR